MKTITIFKSIIISSKPSLVFDALTNASSITSYFPIDEVISDWNVGGPIKLIGKESGVDEGVIDILDHNSRFQYSYWNENHGTIKEPKNYIIIEYSMESCDRGRATQLTLLQTNLPSEEYKKIMDPIWDFLLDRVKSYVEK